MSVEGSDARSAHAAGVERLLASYRAIPPDAPVRLAKKTSNLFRARAATDVPGLDVSGLGGVIAVDPGRAPPTSGMCTYEHLVDATLPHGLAPLVVPQLKTITLGGAVTGLGIESTSFRTGLPHESVLEMDILTGSGEIVTASPRGARRPVPRVPELLRHARLRHAPADRPRTGRAVRGAAACALPRVEDLVAAMGASSTPPASTARGWTTSTGSSSPPPSPTWPGTRTAHRVRSATTPASRSTTAPSSTTGRRPRSTGSPSTTTSGAGTRLVLVLPGVRRATTRGSVASGPAATAAAPSTGSSSRSTTASHRRPPRDAQGPAAAGKGGAGHRGADRAHGRVRGLVPGESPSSRSGCARCAARRRIWPLYPLRPGETYVNVGFWSSVPPGPQGAANRLIEGRSPRSMATSRCTPTLLRRVPVRNSTAASPTGPSRSATTPTPDCSTSMRRRCNAMTTSGPTGLTPRTARGP